jgi:hypothetical protein
MGLSRRCSMLVGLGLLAMLGLVVWRADVGALAAAAGAVPAAVWPVAALAWLSSYLIRAFRLQQEWRGHRRLGLGACLRLSLLHNAALSLLPMRSGELGYLLMVRREWGVGWAAAAHSLARLRGQDLAVLALFGGLVWPGGHWSVRAIYLLALPLLVFGLWPRLMVLLSSRLPPHWLAVGDDASARARWVGWACSVANWFVRLAVVAALLVALRAAAPGVAAWGALGGELAAALPLQAPASLGSYEAGVWAAIRLFEPAGLPALVAAAWLVHLFCIALLLGAAGVVQVLATLADPAAPARSVQGPVDAGRERVARGAGRS